MSYEEVEENIVGTMYAPEADDPDLVKIQPTGAHPTPDRGYTYKLQSADLHEILEALDEFAEQLPNEPKHFRSPVRR